MGEGLARLITVGSIVLTVASLGLAVVFARKRTRIRIGFDLTRAVVGIGAILVMAMATSITTSTLAVLLAVAGGLALGFTQGSSLEISSGERGLYARRSPVAVVLWGTGIVVMQAAGIASRSGAVRLGQTIAWFSACLGIGLLVGRTGPMRRTVTGAGVAAVVLAIALPTAAFIAGTETPAAAQTIQLTDDEICALTPPNRYAPSTGYVGLYDPGDLIYSNDFSFSGKPLEAAIGGCMSQGWFDYTGLDVDFFVYLFTSDEEALAQWQSEMVMGNEWFADWSRDAAGDESYDPTVDYNAGGLNEFDVTGGWFSVGGVDDRVVMVVGPFMLYGVADNLGFDLGEKNADGYRRPITLIEELITPMVETVGNIEALLVETAPPPDDVAPPDDDTGIPPPGDVTQTDDVAGVPPIDESGAPPPGEDEPIEPEEAAAQAIAGLIAAAAIGLITWAEASADIGQILGTLGSGRGSPPVPPGPTRTIYVSGEAAERVLQSGPGSTVPIPSDQQWDENVSVPRSPPVQSGRVGSVGVVRTIGPVVRGADGSVSVAVDVDAFDPVAPPPPAPATIPTSNGPPTGVDGPNTPPDTPPPRPVPGVPPDVPLPPVPGVPPDVPLPPVPGVPPDTPPLPPVPGVPPDVPLPPVPGVPPESPPIRTAAGWPEEGWYPPDEPAVATPPAQEPSPAPTGPGESELPVAPVPAETPPPSSAEAADADRSVGDEETWTSREDGSDFLGRDTADAVAEATGSLLDAREKLDETLGDLGISDETRAEITERLAPVTERVESIKDKAELLRDTVDRAKDIADETDARLQRLGVPERLRDGITWMRWMTEGVSHYVQGAVDEYMSPATEKLADVFGGDASDYSSAVVPVEETGGEFSEFIVKAAENIKGGDNYAGQLDENEDIRDVLAWEWDR